MTAATAHRSTTRVVLDATAFVRSVDPEAQDDEARAWLEAAAGNRVDASAPDGLFLEIANALRGLAQAERLERHGAALALDLVSLPAIRVVPTSDIVRETLHAALETGRSAYDASYLVVAGQSDAVLVTADHRLAAAYQRTALLPGVGPEDVFGLSGQGD